MYETRNARNQHVFQGPGQTAGDPEPGIVPEKHALAAELFIKDHPNGNGGPDWVSKFKNLRVGDLMSMGGFYEKSDYRRGTRILETEDVLKVAKALEFHLGMNYAAHGGGHGQYACQACCTCW